MTPIAEPPAWLERTLILLLNPRDRETIPGDLREAYRDTKLPRFGRLRANLWYARQVSSLAPRCFVAAAKRTPGLALLCLFTGLAGGWLGLMDFYLRHPGYAGREWIAGVITGQALLTLAAISLRGLRTVRAAAVIGCTGILYLAAKALVGTLRGDHFEGYILLIALALTAQAVLTLRALTRLVPS